MSAHKRILVVDDEEDILNLLDYTLSRAGFEVFKAKDGPEAIETALSEVPSLIVLDIMLPNMDGTDVLKRLKESGATRNIPVIMLTAKGDEIDKIVGLELGAEDYVTKPFSPREFILRVKAVLKRAGAGGGNSPEEDKVISQGELILDMARHRVSVAGTPVKLSTKEFKLLQKFMTSHGRVLSRDGLLESVWGDGCYVSDRTVDTHIRRLRAKLDVAGKYIETVRGVGYRFVE
ncbi:MAG: response regulator [Thermodesulfobacteriota bacterium]